MLELADTAIEQQRLTIDAQAAQNERLTKSLVEANSELDRREAWYRQPQTTLTAGLLAGLLLGVWVRK